MTQGLVETDGIFDVAATAERRLKRRARVDIRRSLSLMTPADVEGLVDVLGLESIKDLGQASPFDTAAALAFVVARADDPALTFEDVRTSWGIDVVGDAEDVHPTKATGSTNGHASSSESPA
jgi:hypothetical protein